MTTSHTPTPWIVNGKSIEYGEGLSGGLVAACVEDVFGNSIDDADMAHIVRCVNAHDDLVAALQRAQMAILGYAHRNDIIQAALDATDCALAKAIN
jgi:hypothetical protein